MLPRYLKLGLRVVCDFLARYAISLILLERNEERLVVDAHFARSAIERSQRALCARLAVPNNIFIHIPKVLAQLPVLCPNEIERAPFSATFYSIFIVLRHTNTPYYTAMRKRALSCPFLASGSVFSRSTHWETARVNII